ncbi:MAG: hypothetical protein H8E36_10610 [Rhodospirillaceae bacterium]|nr:hypothetical protein [Rhodospirillaceae bacterium]MBL6930318.1 hypothetical protein [Rhodospirillales bacterium]
MALLIVFIASPAFSAETITFDNQSKNKIKLVAPGGSAVLEPDSGPVTVSFKNEDSIGVDINIWWVSNPRQLCQIFTPWQRLVVVSGKRDIRCRSLAE